MNLSGIPSEDSKINNTTRTHTAMDAIVVNQLSSSRNLEPLNNQINNHLMVDEVAEAASMKSNEHN